MIKIELKLKLFMFDYIYVKMSFFRARKNQLNNKFDFKRSILDS